MPPRRIGQSPLPNSGIIHRPDPAVPQEVETRPRTADGVFSGLLNEKLVAERPAVGPATIWRESDAGQPITLASPQPACAPSPPTRTNSRPATTPRPRSRGAGPETSSSSKARQPPHKSGGVRSPQEEARGEDQSIGKARRFVGHRKRKGRERTEGPYQIEPGCGRPARQGFVHQVAPEGGRQQCGDQCVCVRRSRSGSNGEGISSQRGFPGSKYHRRRLSTS